MSSPFVFVGGAACFDLVNTRIAQDGKPLDLLSDTAALLDWLQHAQLLTPDEAQAARKWKTRDAEKLLMDARHLREVLTSIVEAVTLKNKVTASMLRELNTYLMGCAGYTELVQTSEGFSTRFHRDMSQPGNLLVPIAESAREVLCNGDLSLVKKCQHPSCILYFYDTTKNHARRWCSMATCGNRMKATAHYERKRS